LLGAGDSRRAAEQAFLAARAAEESLAYSLAADMDAVTAAHDAERRVDALRRRAANLDRAGRYAECADCWASIAAAADANDAPNVGDALTREASARYAANQANRALEILGRAFAVLGRRPLRPGALHVMLDLLPFALGAGTRRPLAAPSPAGENAAVGVSPEARRDLALAFSAFVTDQITGLRLMLRTRDALLRSRDAVGVAICHYFLWGLAMNVDRHDRRSRLATRYHEAAERGLSGRVLDDPAADLIRLTPLALSAQRSGEWERSWTLHTSLIDVAERNGLVGTAPYRIGLVGRFSSAVWSQKVALAAEAHGALRGEIERTNNYWLWGWEAHQTLKLYRMDPSLDDLEQWLASAPDGLGPRQRLEYELAAAVPQWIAGDVRGAARRLRAAFARHLRVRTTMFTGVYASLTALTEATALRAGDPDASAGLVRRCARIAAVAPPWAVTRAIRALAYVADAERRPGRACALLRQAAAEATRRGQPVDAAIAEYQLGLRLGGDEGDALRRAATASVEAAGLRTPDCLREDQVGLA
jgi:hypothetical protein